MKKKSKVICDDTCLVYKTCNKKEEEAGYGGYICNNVSVYKMPNLIKKQLGILLGCFYKGRDGEIAELTKLINKQIRRKNRKDIEDLKKEYYLF